MHRAQLDALFRSNMGLCLHKQGKYDEAITANRKAILLQPDSHYAYYLLGEALAEKGEYGEAIAVYKIPRKTRRCRCLNGSFLQEMRKYESWGPNADRKARK